MPNQLLIMIKNYHQSITETSPRILHRIKNRNDKRISIIRIISIHLISFDFIIKEAAQSTHVIMFSSVEHAFPVLRFIIILPNSFDNHLELSCKFLEYIARICDYLIVILGNVTSCMER